MLGTLGEKCHEPNNASPEPVQASRKSQARHDQVLISRVGLRFPPSLTYNSWERAGAQLSRILDSSAWCLGDWLVCGQENYADRYIRAIDAAGLWRAATRRSNDHLENWMVLILDRAAEDTLSTESPQRE
ncbi:MAG: hypothetical protein QOI21_2789 [Actinomycetota bacterium]|jgi:hypothetical protein|nr:hypothetical protein [Actinomycetota bacterium]